ncbi:hypothetical protein P691DRAFT_768012 [Macrolepiota fuliginosa MF-IS2]|uniref:Uncharacterized protein n=1 Tax=Macrolepiota fuliginosa MF-IS2 TaxID=1400762 RepID=A0A9P5WYV5_9AGAR|nr:hypothetical protein P691DRAFT_768012 [Macrolepiota fuliginosa MF-IS2]
MFQQDLCSTTQKLKNTSPSILINTDLSILNTLTVPANQCFIWVDAPKEIVNPCAPELFISNSVTPKPKAPHTKKSKKTK